MHAINSFWPESRIDSVLVMRPQISFALLSRSGKPKTRSKTQAHQSVATEIVYCRCWPLPFCKYTGGRNHAFAISNICWTLILCRLHTLNFAGRRWSRNHAFGPHFRISASQDVHWFNEAWPRALANQLQTAQCHRPIPARSFKCIGYSKQQGFRRLPRRGFEPLTEVFVMGLSPTSLYVSCCFGLASHLFLPFYGIYYSPHWPLPKTSLTWLYRLYLTYVHLSLWKSSLDNTLYL